MVNRNDCYLETKLPEIGDKNFYYIGRCFGDATVMLGEAAAAAFALAGGAEIYVTQAMPASTALGTTVVGVAGSSFIVRGFLQVTKGSWDDFNYSYSMIDKNVFSESGAGSEIIEEAL